ncbi:hypothetical protein C0J50_23915 [Silurus asotus]|uniref:Groucho/TLE N-terminal Q-rich domain-containing protein n=1 Tax=Silurus asotus TaxID=30991 RepID=A0AAD5AHQ4_SILAS|nr:hypothetical protein C0J50_23915 [Silurus asotus]
MACYISVMRHEECELSQRFPEPTSLLQYVHKYSHSTVMLHETTNLGLEELHYPHIHIRSRAVFAFNWSWMYVCVTGQRGFLKHLLVGICFREANEEGNESLKEVEEGMERVTFVGAPLGAEERFRFRNASAEQRARTMYPHGRPQAPLVPGHAGMKFTVLETLDHIKEEFQLFQAQYHSLKLECEKLATEKTEMHRHYIMYYEMSYGLNIEMQKQAEIVKRLSAICTQIIPLLSQEHQHQVAQAVERSKHVSMADLNAIIGQQQLQHLSHHAPGFPLTPHQAGLSLGPGVGLMALPGAFPFPPHMLPKDDVTHPESMDPRDGAPNRDREVEKNEDSLKRDSTKETVPDVRSVMRTTLKAFSAECNVAEAYLSKIHCFTKVY